MPELLRPDPAGGVFETLLVLDGRPIELEAHLERLSRSVGQLFGAVLPVDTRELMLESVSALSVGRVRLTAILGLDGVVNTAVVTAAVDPEDIFPAWERGVVLKPSLLRGGLGAHKWADRAGLSRLEAGGPERSVPLLLDVGEEVLEASRASVFAVEAETLITPSTDGRILPGVTRALAIDTAASLGIEVREEALALERLLAAGQAFLTGSVRGVEPVRSLDEAEFEVPGATVCALAAEMKQRWVADDAARSTRAS